MAQMLSNISPSCGSNFGRRSVTAPSVYGLMGKLCIWNI